MKTKMNLAQAIEMASKLNLMVETVPPGASRCVVLEGWNRPNCPKYGEDSEVFGGLPKISMRAEGGVDAYAIRNLADVKFQPGDCVVQQGYRVTNQGTFRHGRVLIGVPFEQHRSSAQSVEALQNLSEAFEVIARYIEAREALEAAEKAASGKSGGRAHKRIADARKAVERLERMGKTAA